MRELEYLSGGSVSKRRISVTLTEPYLEALNRLVEAGVYVDRGEAVKDALRRVFRHYGMKPFSPEGEAGALGAESLTENELVERIDVLKEAEASMRAERQELEEKVRHMVCERLQVKGAEG